MTLAVLVRLAAFNTPVSCQFGVSLMEYVIQARIIVREVSVEI